MSDVATSAASKPPGSRNTIFSRLTMPMPAQIQQRYNEADERNKGQNSYTFEPATPPSSGAFMFTNPFEQRAKSDDGFNFDNNGPRTSEMGGWRGERKDSLRNPPENDRECYPALRLHRGISQSNPNLAAQNHSDTMSDTQGVFNAQSIIDSLAVESAPITTTAGSGLRKVQTSHAALGSQEHGAGSNPHHPGILSQLAGHLTVLPESPQSLTSEYEDDCSLLFSIEKKSQQGSLAAQHAADAVPSMESLSVQQRPRPVDDKKNISYLVGPAVCFRVLLP